MEFNEKLQKLRMQAGLTQEQLAEKLFVSRVTVSKWESGRGYPNIGSLKLVAKVLSVSIDDLLSGEEIVSIAESQAEQASLDVRSLVFGILDIMLLLLLVLPLFGNKEGDRWVSVALPSLRDYSGGILAAMYGLMIATAVHGVLELALQNFRNGAWIRSRSVISICLSALSVLLFIMTQQPYAAAFLLCLLLAKGVLLVKKSR